MLGQTGPFEGSPLAAPPPPYVISWIGFEESWGIKENTKEEALVVAGFEAERADIAASVNL